MTRVGHNHAYRSLRIITAMQESNFTELKPIRWRRSSRQLSINVSAVERRTISSWMDQGQRLCDNNRSYAWVTRKHLLRLNAGS